MADQRVPVHVRRVQRPCARVSEHPALRVGKTRLRSSVVCKCGCVATCDRGVVGHMWPSVQGLGWRSISVAQDNDVEYDINYPVMGSFGFKEDGIAGDGKWHYRCINVWEQMREADPSCVGALAGVVAEARVRWDLTSCHPTPPVLAGASTTRSQPSSSTTAARPTTTVTSTRTSSPSPLSHVRWCARAASRCRVTRTSRL